MADSLSEIDRYQTDHDVLIELRTEMKGVREDLRDIKTGNARVTDDHEKRLRELERLSERWLGKQSIASALIGAAFALACAWISGGHYGTTTQRTQALPLRPPSSEALSPQPNS